MVVYYKEACKSTSYQWSYHLWLYARCFWFLLVSCASILHVQIHTQNTSNLVTTLTTVYNTACYILYLVPCTVRVVQCNHGFSAVMAASWTISWMEWIGHGIIFCKKNAAVLLCWDIQQPKDFLLFLGGKTSNYTVMKMPILACCASIELEGQLNMKKVAKHCAFLQRKKSY